MCERAACLQVSFGLTPAQADILLWLADAAPRVVFWDELGALAAPYASNRRASVRVQVCHLRRNLDAAGLGVRIANVYNRGYRIETGADAVLAAVSPEVHGGVSARSDAVDGSPCRNSPAGSSPAGVFCGEAP